MHVHTHKHTYTHTHVGQYLLHAKSGTDRNARTCTHTRTYTNTHVGHYLLYAKIATERRTRKHMYTHKDTLTHTHTRCALPTERKDCNGEEAGLLCVIFEGIISHINKPSHMTHMNESCHI